MQLYTLTPQFFPKDFISEFTSVIWTERYSSAGDVQLVVKPIPSMIEALTPGTRLGLRGVKEIMQIETQSIEDGLMTVTGSSLVKFLNERQAWFPNTEYNGTDTSVRLSADYAATNTVGQFLADVVNAMAVNPAPFVSYWAPISLDSANEKIPGLSVGRIDPNGTPKLLSMPTGPLYDGIASVAAAEAEGFKLYLDSAQYHAQTFVLKFATYRGKDRTSDQTNNLMVRFSPQLDSLTNVKEMSSFADYKNTVYVFYKNQVSVHYIPTLPAAPDGFNRRTLMVEAPDIFLDPAHIPAFRQQVARDAMASHLYIQAVDGQVSSKNEYVFGTDYYLGDIVELEGYSGLVTTARITEYIRSQDKFGEQEYPTLSVIDPIGTNYIPDTEPGVFEPPWEGEDPDWTDDWTPPDLTDPGYDPRIIHPAPIPNPRDPFDLNPDPIPVFGPDDGGSGDGTGDGGGGNGGGGGSPPGANDIGLTPTTPFEVADWLYDTDMGYYVHEGTVYIIGSANADSVDYRGSTLLFQNIPVGLRPTADVSRRVLIDPINSTYEYASDSGLHLGPWLDVTVHTNGTVTLDGGNPFRSAANNTFDYVWLALILSSISWPTASAVADTFSQTGSLDDYVSTKAHLLTEYQNDIPENAWENIDGSFAVHNGRLHLSGKVKASSEWASSYDPLIGIPPQYQPKRSAEPTSNFWCEVPQKDGYRLTISPAQGGYNHALSISGGSQDPQAAGNGGCRSLQRYFYSRYSDGYVSRGSGADLVFTPGTHDVGVSWEGCSGMPIGSLPSMADWRGNEFNANVLFKMEDLPTIGRKDTPLDFLSELDGPNQLSFIIGITPDSSSYYKLVIYRDGPSDQPPPADSYLYMVLYLVQSGGEALYKAGSGGVPPAKRPDGRYSVSWQFRASPNFTDVGLSSVTGGRDFFRISSGIIVTDEFGLTFEGDPTNPVLGCKGNMGIHLPPGSTTAQVSSASITGIGSFPLIAAGDELDLSGCGWPLT